jgi:hypothetical protein
MRMMVTFRFPNDSGNDTVRTGKIAEIFKNLMDDIKPEAAYMYPVDGQRGGHVIINMSDSSDVAKVAERFWFGLKADITMTPVMNPEDLQKGLGDISGIVKRFG